MDGWAGEYGRTDAYIVSKVSRKLKVARGRILCNHFDKRQAYPGALEFHGNLRQEPEVRSLHITVRPVALHSVPAIQCFACASPATDMEHKQRNANV